MFSKRLKQLIASQTKDILSKAIKPYIINPCNERFLGGVKSIEKVCFFCVVVCGMTEREIAHVLDISPHTVKSYIIRVKGHLKDVCGL